MSENKGGPCQHVSCEGCRVYASAIVGLGVLPRTCMIRTLSTSWLEGREWAKKFDAPMAYARGREDGKGYSEMIEKQRQVLYAYQLRKLKRGIVAGVTWASWFIGAACVLGFFAFLGYYGWHALSNGYWRG